MGEGEGLPSWLAGRPNRGAPAESEPSPSIRTADGREQEDRRRWPCCCSMRGHADIVAPLEAPCAQRRAGEKKESTNNFTAYAGPAGHLVNFSQAPADFSRF